MSSRWLLLLLPPLTSSIGPPLVPLAPGLPFAPVDRVVVCAGTHGNEFAGIYGTHCTSTRKPSDDACLSPPRVRGGAS